MEIFFEMTMTTYCLVQKKLQECTDVMQTAMASSPCVDFDIS